MPYEGDYNGQYTGFPAYTQTQLPQPQYRANGMQYPVQHQTMQPMTQPMYQTPINGDIYSKQYYQQYQQPAPVPPRPAQYSPQQPQYQYGQQHQGQYPGSAPGSQYSQTQYRQPSYQAPSPSLQQRPQSQQHTYPTPQPWGYYHQQQPQPRTSPQWSAQPLPAARPPQTAANGPNVDTRPAAPPQRPQASHVPRQAPLAVSPVVSHQHVPSSPDPLAPSPNPRPTYPQPRHPETSIHQVKSRQPPIVARPTANVTQTAHTTQHRVASHVEIPVMSQPAKRRRSNEGNAIAVCEGPSVDYQAALLALSDEYISAAYNLQCLDTEEQLEEYHMLIATGIGCLESVLKNYRHHDARKEARIRLRLATLLVEETENDMEAEETLSKGIALCERGRLTDLKYAMHHLLTRLVFKKSPKAALKATDKLVKEVEALQLLHWMYAFRFLRVCLGIQIPGHSETNAMLKHLTAMSATAVEHRHISVQITVATIEAIVYLRSGTPDAVDLAQRSMAAARTHQLGNEMASMPQVRAILDCLDVSCSLIDFSPDKAVTAMSQMQANMDPASRQPGWSKTGVVHIDLLPSTNSDLALDTSGTMRVNKDGSAALSLRWMSQIGIYVIGYLLSGIVCLHKPEDRRAASFLKEGLNLNKQWAHEMQQQQSLNDRTISNRHQAVLDTASRLLIIFDHCSRFEWQTVRHGIDQTRAKFAHLGLEIDEDTARTLLYLDAMCKQAQGNLDGALQIYQSPELSFEQDVKYASVEKDFRVLSALNSIMILRSMGVDSVDKASDLVNAIEEYCVNHANQSFKAAYFVTKAIGTGKSKELIIKTKQYLSSAVNAAKAAANNQFLVIVMNVMTDLFFHDIIGDQAEKSATAGRSLAKKGGDKLWLCVADSMYGEVKERCGKVGEAEAGRKEGMNVYQALPDALKRKLTIEGANGGM